MSVTPKDWRNATSSTGGGDVSTPLSAAALEDMEARLQGPWANVKDYGALGDGVDDTAAINLAVAALEETQFTSSSGGPALDGPGLFFPPGRYVYTGSALWSNSADGTPRTVNISGAGGMASEIMLSAGAYLIDSDESIHQLKLHDLTVNGGAGVMRSTDTTANVLYGANVFRCNFINYTKAAFSIESSDWPYWTFRDCNFYGSSPDGDQMGIAMVNSAAATVIDSCHFNSHRVAVKCGLGGAGLRIKNSDFIPDAYPASNPRYMVWIVPDPSAATGGVGLEMAGNKWGNELLRAGDKFILIADEGAGTTVADRLPSLGADSTGYCIGFKIGPNLFQGNATWESGGGTNTEIIYSTTPNLWGDIGPMHNLATGDMILRLRTAASVPVHTTIGPVYGLDPRVAAATNATDGPTIIDPANKMSIPTVASTATLTLPPWGQTVAVSGTADITGITASGSNGTLEGRIVTLVFQGTAATNGVVDGSNLKLAGNLLYTPDDTLTLVCGGSGWYEIARSVN